MEKVEGVGDGPVQFLTIVQGWLYRIWDLACAFVRAKLCAKLCADNKICTQIF